MIHPHLTSMLAGEHRTDLLNAAQRRRLARQARPLRLLPSGWRRRRPAHTIRHPARSGWSGTVRCT